MTRVLVREPIADAGVEVLRSRFDVDVDLDSPLEDIIGDYDAIVIRSGTKLDAELLERAERLRVIGRAGVGVDNVDVDAATRQGILVVNAPESTVVSAAEHTIGLLLALSRNIPQAHAAVKAGRWERSRYAGHELAGKTLGLLGFGRIGQQVARRALALGMHVIAFDPFVSRERFRELGVEGAASQEDVLRVVGRRLAPSAADRRDARCRERSALDGARRRASASSTPLAASSSTRMRCSTRSRSGKVAGAALDVFSSEPYTGPLLELDNVVVTPHLAASTEEAQDRAGVIVAEQVAAALEGDLVANAVNMPAVSSEDIDTLGPFVPLARALGTLAMELAGGRAERIVLSYRGRLAESRHTAADGRCAQRRLRGPHRAAGERRQRRARRRRARDRGGGAERAAVAGLHEPRAGGRRSQRRRDGSGRDDDRRRGPALARRRPGLQDRDRARAATWCSSSTTTGRA